MLDEPRDFKRNRACATDALIVSDPDAPPWFYTLPATCNISRVCARTATAIVTRSFACLKPVFGANAPHMALLHGMKLF